MRWSYLVPRVLLVTLVWAFFVLAFDPLLRWGMQKSATSINGATVDVARVQTHFFPPRLEVINVGITDPDHPETNRAQFGTLSLNVDGAALAHRRLVIEEAQLLGLEFDTARLTPGEVAVKDEEDTGPSWVGIAWEGVQNRLQDVGRRWIAGALEQAKTEFDPKKLETVQLAKSLETKWETRIKLYETRLKEIEQRIEALEDGVKTKGNTLERVQAWQRVAQEVQSLIAEAQRTRNELAGLYNEAGVDVQSLTLAQGRDVQAIKKKVQVLKLDRNAITESLVGEDVVRQMQEVNLWVKIIREKFSQLTAIKKPPRSRGIDIEFSKPETGPSFVLQRLAISGVATIDKQRVPYSGTVNDITSNPKLWGKPTRFNLHMQGPHPTDIIASVDRSGDHAIWKLKLSGELPEPKSLKLGESDGLGLQIAAGNTIWEAELILDGEQLAGELSILQQSVRITPIGENRNEIQTVAFEWDERRLLQDALAAAVADVNHIDMKVTLAGTLKEPQWRVHSNLGDEVAAGLTAHMKQQFDQHQAMLLQQVDQLAQAETAKLRAKLDTRFREVAAKLNLSEGKAQQLVQQFANRPLEIGGRPLEIGGRPVNLEGLFRR